MNYYLATLFFFVILISWIWVSVILFGIYSRGVEVEFSVKYKAYQKGTVADLRRQFTIYLTLLWMLEVISGVATIIISSIWMKSIF
jgi:hypothetical protein